MGLEHTKIRIFLEDSHVFAICPTKIEDQGITRIFFSEMKLEFLLSAECENFVHEQQQQCYEVISLFVLLTRHNLYPRKES